MKKLTTAAERCDYVLRIVEKKNFKQHTCYNCVNLLDESGKCDKKHKTKLYCFKFGPFRDCVYHINNETWTCRDIKKPPLVPPQAEKGREK